MERAKRPKKASEFVENKFWIDGNFKEDITTFYALSEKIVFDSMQINNCQNNEKGKEKYIRLWLNWYNEQGDDLTNFYYRVSLFLYRERKIWHNREYGRLNTRNRKHLIYGIRKTLESFNLKIYNYVKAGI